MLETSVVQDTNIVATTYDGALPAEEMDHLREQLAAVVNRYGSARLLLEFGDIEWGRIEPKAAWKDLKTIGALDDISRFAVVTDHDWIQKIGETADALTSADVEIFEADQRDEALVWLRD